MPCGEKAKPETPPLRRVRTTDLHNQEMKEGGWFLRLFGVSVGSAQAHGLIHRTCPNSRLQDSLALTGTYVRTNLRLKSKISRTCDLFQLESSRVSLGKFPGLTRTVRYPVQENSFARKSRKNSTFTMVHGRKQNDQKAKEHNKQQQQQQRR